MKIKVLLFAILIIVIIVFLWLIGKDTEESLNTFKFAKNGQLYESSKCWLNKEQRCICEYGEEIVFVEYYYTEI